MDKKNKTKKVLIVHPFFKILGGAEFVALRIIAILLKKYQYEVTILSYDNFSIENINELSDLSTENSVKFNKVKLPLFLRFAEKRFHTLKIAYLHRIAKQISKSYDICISTYNEIDFGKKGIQYIHHPNFGDHNFLSKFKITNPRKFSDKIPLLGLMYKKVVKLVAGYNLNGLRNNITIVNSNFMGEIVKILYNIKPRVVYPCVVNLPKRKINDWEQRLFQFLSVGRISPEKNIIELINIFITIADNFPSAKFIIIGKISNRGYYKKICKLIEKTKNFNIKILTDLDDKDRDELYQTSKFYIHSKPYEHFGISILEAAASGCLTFVHDSGGMKEIVKASILRYQDAMDLVDKISRIINDKNLRNETLITLKSSVHDFSIEKFDSGFDSALTDLI